MNIFKASNNIFKSSIIFKSKWKPSEINGILFWGDSTEKNIRKEDNKINLWLDKSGRINNGYQNITSQKPIFKKNVINGFNALYFDLAHNIKIDLTLDYFTVISVIKINNDGVLYELGDGVETETGFKLEGSSSSSINTTLNGDTSTRKNTDNSTWLSDGSTYKIITHQYNGTHLSHNLYINNSYISMTTYDDSNPGALSATNKILTYGSDSESDNGISGYIFEVLIYDRNLNVSERTKINDYLKNKYSIV